MNGIQPKPARVFSGDFGPANPLQVVLWSVLREKTINYGVLKIKSPAHNIDGEIAVMWGVFLIGGTILGRKERGYDAIRLLLTLGDGKYDYIDHSSAPPTYLDDGFKLRLTDLISMWPNLPQSMDTNSGRRVSLNRIRAFSEDETQNTEESAIDQNVLQQLQKWDDKTMHLRAPAFWSAAVLFTSIATMLGYLNH